jgi:hypothetical protein
MTKAAELRELAGVLDVTSGDFDISGKSLELDGGRNVQWGGDYSDGFPAIWGNTGLGELRFAPMGANSGIVVAMDDAGIDVTGDLLVALSDNSTYSSTSDTRTSGARIYLQNTDNTTNSITGLTLYTGNSAGSAVEIDAIRSSDAYRASLVFKSRTASGTYAEHMRIGDLGNVGIGTTGVEKLHVAGNIRVNNNQEFRTVDTGGSTRTIMRVNNSDELEYGWSGGGPVKIMGGGSYTERMRLHTNGYVGIRNDSPTVALEVGKLVNGETQLAIFNSEGGNQVGVHVKSRTNRATLQVSDNDSTAFVQAEDSHAIYGQHSSLASADMTIDTAGNMNLQNGTYYVDQVRHSSTPVLHLDFANSKELDSRISFHRGSVGTYYDEKGILRYAQQNEPRFDHNPVTGECRGLLIEEDRQNLTTSGNDFYDWYGLNRVGVIQNAALAPDGTYTASKVVDQPNGDNSRHELWRGFTATSGTTYTFSIYAKAAEHTRFEFVWYGDNGVFGGTSIFDLDSETATNGSGFNARMEDVGNGWYRCSAARTAGASAAGYYGIYMVEESTNNATYVGLADGGMYFWGTQFEVGSFPTSYIPEDVRFSSRSSRASYYDADGILRFAPANSPRYGYKYDGRKMVEAGLITEDAGSNTIQDSYYQVDGGYLAGGFENASLRTILSASSETTTAPDGSTIPILVGTGVSGGAYNYPSEGVTSGTQTTCSVYFRPPTTENGFDCRSFVLYMHNNRFPSYEYVAYDIDLGQLSYEPSTNGAAKDWGFEKLPNNWVRIWLSGVPNNTGSTFSFVSYFSDDVGNNGANLPTTNVMASGVRYGYIWGAQLEQSKTATSYIETKGATANRSADVLFRTGETREDDIVDIFDAEDLIPQVQGTVYTRWSQNEPSGGFGGVFEIQDSGGNDSSTVTNGIDQRTNGAFYMTNNYSLSYGTLPAIGEVLKTAFAYDGTSELDSQTATGGTLQTTNTVHTWNMHMTRIRLGSIDVNPAYQLNGHLAEFRLYDGRMPNAELKALTEND